MEFKKKNDYTAIVFFEVGFPIKMEYVHNCYKLSLWLSSSQKYKDWTYFNIYVRRSSRFLKRAKKDAFIEPFPK